MLINCKADQHNQWLMKNSLYLSTFIVSENKHSISNARAQITNGTSIDGPAKHLSLLRVLSDEVVAK